jgi:hypothetical protein
MSLWKVFGRRSCLGVEAVWEGNSKGLYYDEIQIGWLVLFRVEALTILVFFYLIQFETLSLFCQIRFRAGECVIILKY